jgi:drug/metabolite transporter (DMT)-like permease
MSSRPLHLSPTTGLLLVGTAALLWSFGGTIARFIHAPDSWTIVFWRSYFATVFLLLFMAVQHGPQGTIEHFRRMGWPGVVVGVCFCIASTSFVVALAHTTVANVLLMQAGAPLFAALISFLIFREAVSRGTWIAIAAVIAGVAIMVSETFTSDVSLLGDGLALLITVCLAIATVTTRRHHRIEMVPAVCLGVTLAALFSGLMTSDFAVAGVDFAWLILFGAVNLGFGLAVFVIGARAVAAPLAALISTLEPVLAPIWVWLVHDEVPSTRTIIGGSVVFLALLGHVLMQFRGARR